jgi:cytochrome c556
MHCARSISGLVATALVSSFLLLAAAPLQAASGEEIIKARVNFMEEEVQGQWRVLAGYVKGGKSSLADVEKSALALASLAKKIPAHFPKDTGRGRFPDDMTRALPAIWTDWADFEKDAKRLSDESEKLARLAKAGDKEAVVDMIGESGSYARTKIGCAECHESYRGPRVKK